MKNNNSLGEICYSGFQRPDDIDPPVADLTLVFDENTCAFKLLNFGDPAVMFGKYWYRSGTNDSMRAYLRDIVVDIQKHRSCSVGDIWLDIACNDGTLLGYVDTRYRRIGIDPADDSFLDEAKLKCDEVIQDFFPSPKLDRAIGTKKASVITSIAMFYNVPDPTSFIRALESNLEINGIWVVQLSYTPVMKEQLAFDNICHEHLYYYSLLSIDKLLEETGLEVVGIDFNDCNGGSARFYIQHRKRTRDFFSVQESILRRYVVECVRLRETLDGVNRSEYFNDFFRLVNEVRRKVYTYLDEAVKNGKKVWGYGASTKGNTLLQYFQLNIKLVSSIAERQPSKYGLCTAGSRIPIKSEAEMRHENPDILLVLPWHFKKEFLERERDYLKSGGAMLFPLPRPHLVTIDGERFL